MRLPRPSVLRLAQIFMSEPPSPEAELTADHREAVIELLRQVSGIVSSTAKPRWGDNQLMVESAAAPSWPAAKTFWIELAVAESDAFRVEIVLSAALVAELRAEKTEPAKAPAESSTSTPMPKSDARPSATGALDLLMDVQLAVTMRFGARRLLLREVLDLSPGAVVELDRRVQEPVDLLLDGKLIARGEVVVIDGNYGLRVTDVSPMAVESGIQDG
jgi:flagellar motor switch protein FliN/FliY